MKFCSECGQELKAGTELCPNCGFTINTIGKRHSNNNVESGLQTAAKVFMVLACVRVAITICFLSIYALAFAYLGNGWEILIKIVDRFDLLEILALFPSVIVDYWHVWVIVAIIFYAVVLCWYIPMTVHYFRATARKQQVGLVFKIFCLFVSPIAGFLMFISDYYRAK